MQKGNIFANINSSLDASETAGQRQDASIICAKKKN